jgi:hypothetical protein
VVKHPDADAALDRVLRAAIGSSVPGGGACPGPDEVAAYVEGALTPDERAAFEVHAASCARCLDVLGALARSLEEAVPPPGTAEASEPARTRPGAPWWRGVRLRWAAPVAAVVTAAALYVAVDRDWRAASRPPVVGDAPQDRADAALQAEQAAAPEGGRAPAAASGLPQTRDREANVPEAPVLVARDLPGQAVVEPAAPSKAARPKNEVGRAKSTPVEVAAPGAADVAASPPASPPAPAQVAASAERLRQRDEMAPERRDTAATAPPVAILPGAAPAPGVAAGAAATRTEAAGRERHDLREQVAPTAGSVEPPAEAKAVAPGGLTHWRVGPGGAIERSVDGGATWSTQASGVRTDLLAVTAPAAGTAWAVGRLGTVLRTVDGETWQRLPFPEPVDLVMVEARDGRRAVVTAAGGRRWTTADGGRTWSPVP